MKSPLPAKPQGSAVPASHIEFAQGTAIEGKLNGWRGLFNQKTGIYLYSEWFVYSGYEGGGAWVHTYRDVEGERASNAFWNAKADCEEIEFNRKMGIAS